MQYPGPLSAPSYPSYYRGYEGNGVGIRDEMEARYRGDVRSFLIKYGTLEARSTALLSGHVTNGVDDCWMFCTSLKPMSTWKQEDMRKEFAADSVTVIQIRRSLRESWERPSQRTHHGLPGTRRVRLGDSLPPRRTGLGSVGCPRGGQQHPVTL